MRAWATQVVLSSLGTGTTYSRIQYMYSTSTRAAYTHTTYCTVTTLGGGGGELRSLLNATEQPDHSISTKSHFGRNS